jgi:hypothetical protein
MFRRNQGRGREKPLGAALSKAALAALVGDGLLDVALVASALEAAVEAEDALRAGFVGEQ